MPRRTAIVERKRAPRGAKARAGAAVRAEVVTARGARATFEVRLLGELDIGESIVRGFFDGVTRGLLKP